MDGGWVKLYRKLLEWEWWDDHNTTRLFMYCLMKANHKAKKWRGITIEKGQFVSSLEKFSKGTGISIQGIRTSIKKLKSTSEITSKSTSKYTIVTVCNWELYQIDESADQQAEQQSTQQTSNKRVTTNKNEKKEKKRNTKNDFFSDITVHEPKEVGLELPYSSPEFLDAWNGYLGMRKAKKIVTTDRAMKLLIGRLNKLATSEKNAIEMLHNAEVGNWKSLYEVSGVQQSQKLRKYGT